MKKTPEQLANEMDKAVASSVRMSDEEKIEYDADFGYIEEDD